MKMHRSRGPGSAFVLVVITVCCVSPAVRGQLPTATGRTINLSTDSQSRHKLFIPDHYVHSGNAVDVLIHFHGDFATVNNNAKYANLNAVVINVTYGGLSSAYQGPFSDQSLFGNILADALVKLRAQSDFPNDAAWGNRAISSFSAGYAAVREILKNQSYFDQIGGILLADSLYASFTSSSDHRPLPAHMVDFRRYAMAGAQQNKTLIFSHSQVQTFTYSNTEECADDLIQHVGAMAQPYTATGLGNMQFYRRALLGNFAVYGATGTDAAAHSIHLQYMGQFLDELPLAQIPEPATSLWLLSGVVFALRRRCGAARPKTHTG